MECNTCGQTHEVDLHCYGPTFLGSIFLLSRIMGLIKENIHEVTLNMSD